MHERMWAEQAERWRGGEVSAKALKNQIRVKFIYTPTMTLCVGRPLLLYRGLVSL